ESGADPMIVGSTNDRGVGRYATSAEDYSHSPYLTRTAVSAVRFDHSSSQALYLDSYGPADNQLYSLTIDSTYYDIPGRAPRCMLLCSHSSMMHETSTGEFFFLSILIN